MRRFLGVLVVLLALALAPAAEAAKKRNLPPGPPNVVLIVADDQSPGSVAKMPYLTSRTGWHEFTNAYINNATCCPSRATFLTGLWSHHHGVEATGGAPAFDDSSTLATWLDAAGYRTGMFGKYHLGNVIEDEPETYIPPGWDEWAGWHGIRGHEAYYDYTLNENGLLVPYGSTPADYSTDVIAQKAADFIRSADGEPFFAYVAPRGPHNPWTPAPRHFGAFAGEPVPLSPSHNDDPAGKPEWWQARPVATEQNAVSGYRKEWAAALAVDDLVSKVQHAVQNEGLMERTVIIYMSDNGYAYGEHRQSGKLCLYDPCNRSALLVKYGRDDRGLEWPELVSNEDIAPTIADLAGIAPGHAVDGDSLAPFLRTDAAPAGWPSEALLRNYNRNYDPPGTGKPPEAWGIRTPQFKYIETVPTGEVELYDLAQDPFELTNVAGDPLYTTMRVELALRLLELRSRAPR